MQPAGPWVPQADRPVVTEASSMARQGAPPMAHAASNPVARRMQDGPVGMDPVNERAQVPRRAPVNQPRPAPLNQPRWPVPYPAIQPRRRVVADLVNEQRRVEADPENQPRRVEADPVNRPRRVEADPMNHLRRAPADPVNHPRRVVADPVNHPRRVIADPVIQPRRVEADPENRPRRVEADPLNQPWRVPVDAVNHPQRVVADPENQPRPVELEPENRPQRVEADPEYRLRRAAADQQLGRVVDDPENQPRRVVAEALLNEQREAMADLVNEPVPFPPWPEEDAPFAHLQLVQMPQVSSSNLPCPSPSPDLDSDEVMHKCRTFLLTFLDYGTTEGTFEYETVRHLVQQLVDAEMELRVFSERLEHHLRASAQGNITGLLMENLPELRKSLFHSELSIEGIRPPSFEVTYPRISPVPQSGAVGAVDDNREAAQPRAATPVPPRAATPAPPRAVTPEPPRAATPAARADPAYHYAAPQADPTHHYAARSHHYAAPTHHYASDDAPHHPRAQFAQDNPEMPLRTVVFLSQCNS